MKKEKIMNSKSLAMGATKYLHKGGNAKRMSLLKNLMMSSDFKLKSKSLNRNLFRKRLLLNF